MEQIEINKVYNIDCLELMKQMAEQGIKADWAICDPPYGIGVGSMPYTNGVERVGKALAKRKDYSNTGNWDKRCNEKLRNDFADCEMAWCSKGVARVFRYLYKGMLQGDMTNKDNRFHPTQKPSQLITQLLNYYTKEGD